jgi:hypothetical protein
MSGCSVVVKALEQKENGLVSDQETRPFSFFDVRPIALMHQDGIALLKLRTPLMHFQTVHRDGSRSVDPQANPIALNGDNLHANVIADHNFLSNFPGQD